VFGPRRDKSYHSGVGENTITTIGGGFSEEGDRPVAPPTPIIAGYDLRRIVGRGGHGVVWEAFEYKLERIVALKVHMSTPGGAFVRSEVEVPPRREALWAEALVAARIGDPSIVRVLDMGYTIDERPYYAMELVQGTDLGALIADGPLAPRRAVAIASDMSRAAAAAHRHGVIHRDMKPRNVIVDETGRARVCDFGIAFDEQRGPDPYAGLMAGTPAYMAPEQVAGKPVGPATDIWAIGVMLYEMLTGERPFIGGTTDELLARIIAFDPPPPSTKRESLHADLDAVVMRCLMKTPADRFPNAAVLFETLSAITEGQRVDISSAPRPYVPKKSSGTMHSVRPKPRREDAAKHLAWSWQLKSPPEALWPFVSNTDRFNKAVRLPVVDFDDEKQSDGRVARTGHVRVLGLQVSWREYPFEWIKNREHSVYRAYTTGPILALWNRVKLAPLAGGGTELTHEIWLSPRGLIGQIASFVELDRRLAPEIDRFYRHLDDVIASGVMVDPFEPAFTPKLEQRALVEAACARLHAEHFDSKLIEKLAMHLLSAPDTVLATLRPYALADAWSTDRGETLDAFIHAADAGILEPTWDVICPRCMIAHESLDHLSHVTTKGECAACATTFERDLGESVELVFAPHPNLRSIERVTFCTGSPAKRPHIIAQQNLDPGELREVTIDVPRGTYHVVGSSTTHPFELVASALGFEETCEVSFDGTLVEGRPSIVKAGPVRFRLGNESAVEDTIRLEIAGSRDEAVSAAAALTHPSFRELFSRQLLAPSEHVRVNHLAFLFVGVGSNDSSFDSVGERAVCAELARLEGIVADEARNHAGDVVPSALSTLVVAFSSSLEAVRAALSLRARIAEGGFVTPFALSAHEGRCVALTRAGKPEFFGESLYRGQALLRDCPAGGIVLSASIASDHDVAIQVHQSGLSVAVDTTRDGPYAGRRITLLFANGANDANGRRIASG
jgi:eukaryotic-like serine/threonine-protein kinase